MAPVCVAGRLLLLVEWMLVLTGVRLPNTSWH